MQSWHRASIFFILALGRLWGITETQMGKTKGGARHLEGQEVKREWAQSFTPCSQPRVKCDKATSLSENFIYWGVKIDGLIYTKTAPFPERAP